VSVLGADDDFESALRSARAGEERGFAALYRSLQPGLLGYLRTQFPQDAEDLAAETWIAAARGLRRFHGGESDFRRWIFTIARRRVIDLRRRESKRPKTVPESELAGSGPGLAPAADAEVDGAMATRRALEQIAMLPSAEAEVVLLRVVAGLTASEVAAVTRRSPGAVRVLQHRALTRLSKLLGPTLATVPCPVVL
jgi:RNA polymerase sigma-70 factor (ECF subfamily)